MDRSTAIREVFGSAAQRYATSAIHAGGPDLTAMLTAAELAGSEQVLDIGCGTGHTALAFAARGVAVEAIDLTAAMLAEGRRLATERGLANVNFREGDVAQLPFGDAIFDIVTSRYSAHHYADPAAALGEAARVLRPRGRFMLVDAVAPADAAEDTFLNAIELLRDPSHVRDHSVVQWCEFLRAAGFEAQHRASYVLRIEFDSWVKRVETPARAVAMLRSLLADAPDEIQADFAIGADGSYDMPTAFVTGRLLAVA